MIASVRHDGSFAAASRAKAGSALPSIPHALGKLFIYSSPFAGTVSQLGTGSNFLASTTGANDAFSFGSSLIFEGGRNITSISMERPRRSNLAAPMHMSGGHCWRLVVAPTSSSGILFARFSLRHCGLFHVVSSARTCILGYDAHRLWRDWWRNAQRPSAHCQARLIARQRGFERKVALPRAGGILCQQSGHPQFRNRSSKLAIRHCPRENAERSESGRDPIGGLKGPFGVTSGSAGFELNCPSCHSAKPSNLSALLKLLHRSSTLQAYHVKQCRAHLEQTALRPQHL